MRGLIATITCLIISAGFAVGQVSQGGMPMEVPLIKSRGIPEIVMPAVNNNSLQQKYENEPQPEEKLKPFQFAHGFDVDVSPETGGLWVRNVKGYDVWRVKIRSTGAYSLNLIFNDFSLPQGSRLFLISENQDYFLGAFTSSNNKRSGKFAVAPIAGDELIVHYEVPAGSQANGFTIAKVNHDYMGILKVSERRPLGKEAGSCNVDINCAGDHTWNEAKDAVCRIIVDGREICTGVLLNNTAENERPYILSAAHCYDKPEYAETSVFTFNYESPYCNPLDGDPSNSVTGADMKAFSENLDFSLVELSLVPPPSYRPYFAGWNRSGTLPDSSKSIHHPQGDIKKISTDQDPPLISDFTSDYTPSGFLKVMRWEAGVTEQGSSGGPLFNPAGNVIGTLTGGSATCNNPVNDFYARFDMAWEFTPDSSGQLKYWLDPLNKNDISLEGKRFYTGENFCMSFTNLEDFDEHQNVILYDQDQEAGYWGGSNQLNITEFAERFSIPGEEWLYGISMGVGLIQLTSPSDNSSVTVKVYNGINAPENIIYSQIVPLGSLVEGAMNYIPFDQIVETPDTFFVGFELSNLQPQERFAVYQSLREPGRENFFWFRQQNVWYDFQAATSEGYSMVNVFELLACNVNEPSLYRPVVNTPMEVAVYPNPTRGLFTFEAGQEIFPADVKIYNLIGKEVNARLYQYSEKKLQINLSGNIPGVYFVRFNSKLGRLSEKVIYNPW
ncbi:MAG: T9SS type A sorting domain-containing protein [Mariniphaga sp.]